MFGIASLKNIFDHADQSYISPECPLLTTKDAPSDTENELRNHPAFPSTSGVRE